MRFLLLFMLVLLVSCGEELGDNEDSRGDSQGQQDEEITEFSTRINPDLLIAGRRCEGIESVSDANGTSVTCARNQWLITVDDVNTCVPGGTCSENEVRPIVAELIRSERSSGTPTTIFFDIAPVSAVTPNQSSVIQDYLVRFDIAADSGTVIPKTDS